MTLSNTVASSIIKNYRFSQNAFLPRIVEIPLMMEDGISYKSIVNVGDKVEEGQKIAVSSEYDGEKTFIRSSVPGTVVAIEPCFSPNGRQTFAVKIKTGGSFSYIGKIPKEKNTHYTNELLSKKLIEDGVINTFYSSKPQNFGIQLKKVKPKTNIIVRLFDEDPYRITDSLISRLYFEQIIKGAKILSDAIGFSGIVFCVDQKMEDKSYFSDKNPELDKNVAVLQMNLKNYPYGIPREIISAFKKSGLKKTCGFEISKNDLFVDSTTIYKVYKSACLSVPSINSLVHFSGDCLNLSCMLDVKNGSLLKDFVSQLGYFVKTPEMVIINGRVCGVCVQTLEVPVTLYVKSVEFISKQKKLDEQIYTCVNCGNCRVACPVKLSPDILYNNISKFKHSPENFAKSSLACLECGLCNTVCPARLPLSQTISVLKKTIEN